MTIHRIRRLATMVSVLLFVAAAAGAQPKIRAFSEVIVGHQVGGVAIDAIGNIFVADFGDVVWKVTPEGERREFASGLYGSSGNAIDKQGNLLQSSFYGDSITLIDRKGQARPFVTSNLSGPVGIAISKQTGEVYVANCRSNTVARVAASTFVTTGCSRLTRRAQSPLSQPYPRRVWGTCASRRIDSM
jgi:DNA-binding beta-propeller fold protein YncE